MYTYINYLQIFTHTSVTITFKNHYMLDVKYIYD